MKAKSSTGDVASQTSSSPTKVCVFLMIYSYIIIGQYSQL